MDIHDVKGVQSASAGISRGPGFTAIEGIVRLADVAGSPRQAEVLDLVDMKSHAFEYGGRADSGTFNPG